MTDSDTTVTSPSTFGCSRRQLLVGSGVGVLGVASMGVLAACGSSSSGGSSVSAAADGSIAKLADIPVGGALAATGTDGKPILLVQATEGTVTAVSAVCTHQGCTVAAGTGTLTCPCHGSVFALDGSVTNGPASTPLPSVDVHVSNGTVFLGKA
ncbi:MAG: Rieske (2Fe-2S) protein [Actinobacteria bacterium]|nr:Rieske (2Fe-2S) protein [Actinomycetota bacterium]MCG2802515.1 Rieske (2Fe-2S) protein [Cellulomonas sp.]